MSIKSANLWSKIGFLFGCACFLALLTADLSTYVTTGEVSLPLGLHVQAVMLFMAVTLGCTFTQIAIWRMRHQQAQQREVVREVVVEALADLARRAEPEPVGDLGEMDGLSAESIAIGRRISTRLNHSAR